MKNTIFFLGKLMNMRSLLAATIIVVLICSLTTIPASSWLNPESQNVSLAPSLPKVNTSVPSPAEILGYIPGTPYKFTMWKDVIKYFSILANSSDRVIIEHIGKSTLGRDMIIVIISSPSNIRKLSYYKAIAHMLSNPRMVTEDLAKSLISSGKVIVWLNMEIHSSECVSAEAALQFAYELASFNDERTRMILDNVIVIINPSMNPDGHDIYREWYARYRDTEYVGTSPPLYHIYAGHDNNRDWHEGNLVETRNVWKAFMKWRPQVFIDNHQMGRTSYRMFVPPYVDPVNQYIDPLIMYQWYASGGAVATYLESLGFEGVSLETIYDLFFPGYGDSWPSLHNAIGQTWELASAAGLTPVYVEYDELRKSVRTFGIHNPDPWSGGEWGPQHIAQYFINGWWALLEWCTKYKEQILYNYYLISKRNIEIEGSKPPYAYVIPMYQKDPKLVERVIDKLVAQGIEVQIGLEDFTYNGRTFEAGKYYIVYAAQPFADLVRVLLERDIPVGFPYFYDVTAWSYSLLKGIEVIPVNTTDVFHITTSAPLKSPTAIKGRIIGEVPATYGYIIDHVPTAFKLLNELLRRSETAEVYFLAEEVSIGNITFRPGAIFIRNVDASLIKELTEKYGLTTYAINEPLGLVKAYRVKSRPKVGIYFANEPGSITMNAGWNRLLMEMYGFDWIYIYPDDISIKNFKGVDILIVPAGSSRGIVDENLNYPLIDGIGKEGVAIIEEWIKNGGHYVGISYGGGVLLLKYGTGIVEANISKSELEIPGSIGLGKIDTTNFLGYGYDEYVPVYLYWPPLLTAKDEYVVMKYAENPFLSGYFGEKPEELAGKPLLLDIHVGSGRAVLFGFDPSYRCWTDATFMILFNAIYRSVSEPTSIAIGIK